MEVLVALAGLLLGRSGAAQGLHELAEQRPLEPHAEGHHDGAEQQKLDDRPGVRAVRAP